MARVLGTQKFTKNAWVVTLLAPKRHGCCFFLQLLEADTFLEPMFISKVLKSLHNRSEEALQMFGVVSKFKTTK